MAQNKNQARQQKRDTVTRIEVGGRAGSAHSDEATRDSKGRSRVTQVIKDRVNGKDYR